MTINTKFFFKRKLRLLTASHFKYVLSKSNKTKFKEIIILSRSNLLNYPRLGISISKKNVKKSYKRNQMKRIIRESFRLFQHKLICSDFVIILNSESQNISSKLLSRKLESLWTRYYR